MNLTSRQLSHSFVASHIKRSDRSRRTRDILPTAPILWRIHTTYPNQYNLTTFYIQTNLHSNVLTIRNIFHRLIVSTAISNFELRAAIMTLNCNRNSLQRTSQRNIAHQDSINMHLSFFFFVTYVCIMQVQCNPRVPLIKFYYGRIVLYGFWHGCERDGRQAILLG